MQLYDLLDIATPRFEDQCRSTSGHSDLCTLLDGHDGDCAELSLSGLVLAMWPAPARRYCLTCCESETRCECGGLA